MVSNHKSNHGVSKYIGFASPRPNFSTGDPYGRKCANSKVTELNFNERLVVYAMISPCPSGMEVPNEVGGQKTFTIPWSNINYM